MGKRCNAVDAAWSSRVQGKGVNVWRWGEGEGELVYTRETYPLPPPPNPPHACIKRCRQINGSRVRAGMPYQIVAPARLARVLGRERARTRWRRKNALVRELCSPPFPACLEDDVMVMMCATLKTPALMDY